MKKMKPDFSYENELMGPVAGLDEAGRGPWAGPVVAAACILDPQTVDKTLLGAINDSKKIAKEKRTNIYTQLTLPNQPGLFYGIGEATVQEIDQLNILRATFLAMKRAVAALPLRPKFLLIDGNQDPKLGFPSQLIVKGDAKSLSIAAASIVAKVHRDSVMANLAQDYPNYGWETNAGYGTQIHQDGLASYGVTPHHRLSYAPIKKCLQKSA